MTSEKSMQATPRGAAASEDPGRPAPLRLESTLPTPVLVAVLEVAGIALDNARMEFPIGPT